MALTRWPDLHVTHRAELIPASADQRRQLPALGHGLGGVAAVLHGVAVAQRAATAISAAVHSAPLPPAHSRLLARCPAPGPGSAASRQMHGRWRDRRIAHGADP